MEALFENPGLSHVGLQILEYLDPETLANCRLVNWTWCNLITEERFWAVARLDLLKVKALYAGLETTNATKWMFWSLIVKNAKEKQSKRILRKLFDFLNHQLNLTNGININQMELCEAPWIGMEQLLINGEIEFTRQILQWLKEMTLFQSIRVDVDTFINTSELGLCLSVELGLGQLTKLLLSDPLKDNINVNQSYIVPYIVTASALDPKTTVSTKGKVIEALLQTPELNVNDVNSKGETALHLATKIGDIETMSKLLARNDINVNAQDDKLATPLHFACVGKIESMKELLKSDKIDVNARDANGMTPLHRVCLLSHEKTKLLLKHKRIDVNATTTIDGITGTTPLHLVFRNLAHVPDKLSKALLKAKGIDVNAVDGEGMTPRDYLQPSRKRRLASQKAEEAIKSSFASTTKRRKRI